MIQMTELTKLKGLHYLVKNKDNVFLNLCHGKQTVFNHTLNQYSFYNFSNSYCMVLSYQYRFIGEYRNIPLLTQPQQRYDTKYMFATILPAIICLPLTCSCHLKNHLCHFGLKHYKTFLIY